MKKGGIHVACKRWTGLLVYDCRACRTSFGGPSSNDTMLLLHYRCFQIYPFSFLILFFFSKESETFVDDLSLDKIPNIYRVTIEFGFLFCRSVIHWKLNATKSRPKKAYCMHSFEIYALSRDLIKLISTTENRGLYACICSTRNFYRFLSVDPSEKNT